MTRITKFQVGKWYVVREGSVRLRIEVRNCNELKVARRSLHPLDNEVFTVTACLALDGQTTCEYFTYQGAKVTSLDAATERRTLPISRSTPSRQC